MTDKERDTMRRMQDRIISYLAQHGVTDDDVILDDITMNDLRTTIYPKHKALFECLIDRM